MRLFLTTAFALFIFINCEGQYLFDDGYFIDNENNKVRCLIKLGDWRLCPTKLTYKMNEDGAVKTLTAVEIQEFGLGDGSFQKYISRKVDIDTSSDLPSMLSTTEQPIFAKEHLFLKEIVKGPASLYEFRDKARTRMFYNIENGEFQQLIHKEFRDKYGDRIKIYQYRKQLIEILTCQKNSKKRLESISYNVTELQGYFISYNECKDPTFVHRTQEEKRQLVKNQDLVNISVRSGVYFTYLNANSGGSPIAAKYEFETKPGIRFGAEFELYPRYNSLGKKISKNNWCILIEPLIQSYASTITIQYKFNPTTTLDEDVSVSYSTIEMPIGIRYIINSNENIAYQIDASYVLLQIMREGIFDFNSLTGDEELTPGGSWRIGIGVRLFGKFSASLELNPARQLFSKTDKWNALYRTVGLAVGYRLF